MLNYSWLRLTRAAGIVSLLAIAASLSFASTPAKPGAGLADTIALLTRQSEAWDKAIVRKDKAAIAANMSEDFRQIGSSGDVSNKAEFVRDLTSDDITIDPYTVEDFN